MIIMRPWWGFLHSINHRNAWSYKNDLIFRISFLVSLIGMINRHEERKMELIIFWWLLFKLFIHMPVLLRNKIPWVTLFASGIVIMLFLETYECQNEWIPNTLLRKFECWWYAWIFLTKQNEHNKLKLLKYTYDIIIWKNFRFFISLLLVKDDCEKNNVLLLEMVLKRYALILKFTR